MSDLGKLNKSIDQLRALIREAVSDCNATAYPKVCQSASVDRQYVESVILDYCIKHGVGVGQAMNMIEVEKLV